MKDRKDRIETVLTEAVKVATDEHEMSQAWLRLCRELQNLSSPDARPPRFNGLLNAVWIAASNDQT